MSSNVAKASIGREDVQRSSNSGSWKFITFKIVSYMSKKETYFNLLVSFVAGCSSAKVVAFSPP